MTHSNQNLLQRLINRLNENDKSLNHALANNAYIRAVIERSIEERKPLLLEDEKFEN